MHLMVDVPLQKSTVNVNLEQLSVHWIRIKFDLEQSRIIENTEISRVRLVLKDARTAFQKIESKIV